MFPLLLTPINPGPTEWDFISIDDEPTSTADIIEEEIDTSDDSITSEESSNSNEERSVEEEIDTSDDSITSKESSNSSEERSVLQ